MKSTLNFTGRKRITRDLIQLSVDQPKQSPLNVNATVNLKPLGLSDDAVVYLEAYNRARVKRFAMGRVSEGKSLSGGDLSDFASSETLFFRLLVVDESGPQGRILAAADRLKPSGAEGDRPAQSLLPVMVDDLGQQVWRVDFDGEGPTLVLNSNVPDVKHLALSDARFFQYVFPAVIRQILNRAVFVEGTEQSKELDQDEWWANWLRFTEGLIPADQRPILDSTSNDFDYEQAAKWIEDVVSEFCTKYAKRFALFVEELEGGEK